MPTYQYTCQQCAHEMEISQKITAEPLKTCPACNKDSLVRGIGGGFATLRFQGSGFYITDYGPKKDAAKENSTSASASPCPCGKPTSCSTQK